MHYFEFAKRDATIYSGGTTASINTGLDEITLEFGNVWKCFTSTLSIETEKYVLIEYIVVKHDVVLGKLINHKHQITQCECSPNHEIIVHVTVNNGKIKLTDQNDNPIQSLIRGKTYLFVYQDNSFNNHPLRFSDTNDGFWNI